ncbi:hypothetical protein RFI_13125 [Reticulomyxa filosa]|uniref:Uncharacterized protein n=1 Tax=Reticulomyxa filosa TaxID=46433 RepID=X6NCJ5_RETFI|nr:hypothetical protein RFI_13125 [Reticulomyxa filosa]|eukprot:ETO24030.1 hypothetical protein RFI_13125 [Reticulomyxa filosa]
MVGKPFGQVRLNCLELLTISADFAQFKCGKVLGNLKFDFWKAILDLAFTHKANNLFLCHFRRLVHLSMIFKRRFLKNTYNQYVHLLINTHTPKKKALHSYILQMLWDIYHHDQRETESATNETKDKKDETNEEDSQSDNGSVVIYEDENDEENQDKDKNKDKNKDKDKDEDNKSDTFGQNENFVLKPNFSTEPEDQWSIAKFFDTHPKWSNFSKVLTQQIEIQMSSEQLPLQQGNGMSQLDALLSHFTEDGADENEQQAEGGDSSDSDVLLFFFCCQFVIRTSNLSLSFLCDMNK